MPSQIVTYELDDSRHVQFEIEPAPGFRPAGADEVAGRVREAVTPVLDAANTILDKIREAGPDRVELRFGVKVSGSASWLVAKAASEGNFEITLTWSRRSTESNADGE